MSKKKKKYVLRSILCRRRSSIWVSHVINHHFRHFEVAVGAQTHAHIAKSLAKGSHKRTSDGDMVGVSVDVTGCFVRLKNQPWLFYGMPYDNALLSFTCNVESNARVRIIRSGVSVYPCTLHTHIPYIIHALDLIFTRRTSAGNECFGRLQQG